MDKNVKKLNQAVEKVTLYEKSQGKVLPEYFSTKEKAELYDDTLKSEKKAYRKAKKEYKDNERNEYYKMVAQKKTKGGRTSRHRPLKNFGWWFVGFLSFIVIFAGSICAALFLIPVNKIGGEHTSEYVSDDIGNATLGTALLNLTSYTVEDVPALQLLIDTLNESLSLDDYVVIDLDSMKDTKVLSQDMLDGISSNIKVVATLSSVGMANVLDMSAFSDFVEVDASDLPDESGKDFNTYLYYYKVDDTNYARAFDNEHNRLEDAKEKTLYYPALNNVVLTELGEVFADRIKYEKMTSLLSVFGMESGTLVDIVGDKTVGDMSDFDINDVKMSVVFEVDESNTKLRGSLVDMTKGSVIDKIACEKYLEANDSKTEDDWNNLTDEDKEVYVTEANNSYPTIDNYAFEEYVKADSTKTRADWNALTDADKESYIATATTAHPDIVKEQYDLIYVGDLTKADMDKIMLKTVMSSNSNEKMYAILCDMTGKTEDELTVGDLSAANVDDIKLTSVMPETEANRKLYNVLEDMTRVNLLNDMACEKYLEANADKTEEDWNTLTDAEKSSYTSEAKTEYNALTKDEKHNLIRVTHMGNGDVTHIKLTSILDYIGNEKLYRILYDLTIDNVTKRYIFENYDIFKIQEDEWKGKEDYQTVTNDDGVGKPKSTWLAEAKALFEVKDTEYYETYYAYIKEKYNIEKETFDAFNDDDVVYHNGEVNKTKAQIDQDADGCVKSNRITVASLDDSNVSSIRLKNVIGESDNVIFKALLKKDSEVTVGSMSDTIDNLTISEIYGDTVFTDDISKACTYGDGKQAKYTKSTNANGKTVYTMDNTATTDVYYISNDASIWLFMLYNYETVDSDGFGVAYTDNGLKLSGISESISDIKLAISSASIRQLVAAGILNSTTNYDPLGTGKYALTLDALLNPTI